MTKVRRPILLIANLLLLLLGAALLAGNIALRHSGNLALLHHPPAKEVQAAVYQTTDIKKLQAMAVNQYEYLDSLAMIVKGCRSLALSAGVMVIIFASLNCALIPWRIRKREAPPNELRPA